MNQSKDTNTTSEKLYTLPFLLMCVSTFLFFASFNIILPKLPDYLSSLGGEDYKGLIIGLFALTAGFSRPFSGKLADNIGRMPVIIFGAVICVIVGFLYPILTSVVAFLCLRFFHGLSTGFLPTGTSAFVADSVPLERRGEAMGILGLGNSVGMTMGFGLGGYLALYVSMETLFYISSVFALCSILILLGIKDTLQEKKPFSFKLLQIKRDEIIEPRALPPAIVMGLSAFSFGTILTLIPDFSAIVGLENKGLFLTLSTIASLSTRFFAGKASDKFGRVAILRISTLLLMFTILSIGFTTHPTLLLILAIFFGIATGMNSPALFAWTIDLGLDQHRGRALATLFIALEVGISSGALISGWIYDNQAERFPYVFGACSILAGMAFLYLWIYKSHRRIAG